MFQVGAYFVGQYYQVLQQQPDFVHQFYTDASTVLRVDGNTRETASAMLVILLNFVSIVMVVCLSICGMIFPEWETLGLDFMMSVFRSYYMA